MIQNRFLLLLLLFNLEKEKEEKTLKILDNLFIWFQIVTLNRIKFKF
jgi:hypothetical protein